MELASSDNLVAGQMYNSVHDLISCKVSVMSHVKVMEEGILTWKIYGIR